VSAFIPSARFSLLCPSFADSFTGNVVCSPSIGRSRSADTCNPPVLRSLRERVAIASVLAMDTPAVVLDESTGGQDARGVERVGAAVDALVDSGRLVALDDGA